MFCPHWLGCLVRWCCKCFLHFDWRGWICHGVAQLCCNWNCSACESDFLPSLAFFVWTFVRCSLCVLFHRSVVRFDFLACCWIPSCGVAAKGPISSVLQLQGRGSNKVLGCCSDSEFPEEISFARSLSCWWICGKTQMLSTIIADWTCLWCFGFDDWMDRFRPEVGMSNPKQIVLCLFCSLLESSLAWLSALASSVHCVAVLQSHPKSVSWEIKMRQRRLPIVSEAHGAIAQHWRQLPSLRVACAQN